MSEPKSETAYFMSLQEGENVRVYLKDEVDSILAEKDKEIEELKMQANAHNNRANLWYYNAQNEHSAAVTVRMENAKLKAELEDVRNTYKDAVEIKVKIWERCKKAEADAAETLALLEERNRKVVELTENARRLKRALYKACANWADVEVFERTVGIDDPNVEANRWALMRNKCLKKAEEYK